MDEPWHHDATVFDRDMAERIREHLPPAIREANERLKESARHLAIAVEAASREMQKSVENMRALLANIPPEQLRAIRSVGRWHS